MSSRVALTAAFAVLACAAAATNTSLPSLDIPACPSKGYLSYNLTSPDRVAFPDTAVEICYDDSVLHVDFFAYNETSFYYNPNYTTNGDIFNYEVMEVFIAKGTSDPQTYLEFEVAPNNVTFQVRTLCAMTVDNSRATPLTLPGLHLQSVHQQERRRSLRYISDSHADRRWPDSGHDLGRGCRDLGVVRRNPAEPF